MNGTSTFSFRAWDRTQGTIGGTFDTTGNLGGIGAFSSNTKIATITVNAVNDAPVLNTATPSTLFAVIEDITN